MLYVAARGNVARFHMAIRGNCRLRVEGGGDVIRLAPGGSLAAILNPRPGKCLSKIHRDPVRQWTVEAMAREAGMSRTVFAERFTGLTGMTPLNYVTRRRMQCARRELIDTAQPLIWIAEQAGYGSAASFNRAFKRQFNVAPGKMRRAAARPALAEAAAGM